MADPKTTKKTVKKAPAAQAPNPDEEVWSIPFPEGEDPDLTGGGFPAGSFLLRCIEKPKQTLTQKQDPQIEFQMECIDPNAPEGLIGRQSRIYCSLKPKAWWFLINVLDAMGVKHNVSVEERKLDFNPNDCIGGILIGIFEENDQRPGRTRINGVLAPDDGVENISDEGGAEEETGEPTFECPECGKPVPQSADKCPSCGVEFE